LRIAVSRRIAARWAKPSMECFENKQLLAQRHVSLSAATHAMSLKRSRQRRQGLRERKGTQRTTPPSGAVFRKVFQNASNPQFLHRLLSAAC